MKLTAEVIAIILQHKPHRVQAQRACKRAGYRVTLAQIDHVFHPR